MPFRKKKAAQFKPGDLVWVKRLTHHVGSQKTTLPYGIRARHPHYSADPHSYPALGVIVRNATGPSGVTYYQVLIGPTLEWASPYDIEICNRSTECSGLTPMRTTNTLTPSTLSRNSCKLTTPARNSSHNSRTGTYMYTYRTRVYKGIHAEECDYYQKPVYTRRVLIELERKGD